MNDADLLTKMKGITETVENVKKLNFPFPRTISPTPLAYLKDVKLEEADLPRQLVDDMLINKQKSIYYPYFVKVVPNQGCDDD